MFTLVKNGSDWEVVLSNYQMAPRSKNGTRSENGTPNIKFKSKTLTPSLSPKLVFLFPMS